MTVIRFRDRVLIIMEVFRRKGRSQGKGEVSVSTVHYHVRREDSGFTSTTKNL